MAQLTDDEKAAIREEEEFRKSVRDELAPEKPDWLETLLSPESLKWVASTVAIPLVVWIAAQSQERQHDATLKADKEIAEGHKEVDELTALVPGLSSSDATQRKIALAVLAQLASVKSASPTIHDIYQEVSNQAFVDQTSKVPEKVAAGVEAKKVLIKNGADAPAAPSAATAVGAAQAPEVSTSKTAPPPSAAISSQTFAYVQIYREAQRAEAGRLSAAIQGQGIPVLGIQNVVTGATAADLRWAQRGSIDIRFYHPEDKAAALSLVPVIKSISPEFGEPTVHDLSSRPHVGRVGTLEVWYPCSTADGDCKPAP